MCDILYLFGSLLLTMFLLFVNVALIYYILSMSPHTIYESTIHSFISTYSAILISMYLFYVTALFTHNMHNSRTEQIAREKNTLNNNSKFNLNFPIINVFSNL